MRLTSNGTSRPASKTESVPMPSAVTLFMWMVWMIMVVASLLRAAGRLRLQGIPGCFIDRAQGGCVAVDGRLPGALRFFERVVLRYDAPADQPAHQAAFVPVVEKIRVRFAHGGVLRVERMQQFHHSAPLGRHALARRRVGGDAAAVLVPAGQAVVPADG